MNRAVSSDIEALRAALAVAQARADEAEAKALEATAKAKRAVAEVSNAEAIIAALKLQIERLRHDVCAVPVSGIKRPARRTKKKETR